MCQICAKIPPVFCYFLIKPLKSQPLNLKHNPSNKIAIFIFAKLSNIKPFPKKQTKTSRLSFFEANVSKIQIQNRIPCKAAHNKFYNVHIPQNMALSIKFQNFSQ